MSPTRSAAPPAAPTGRHAQRAHLPAGPAGYGRRRRHERLHRRAGQAAGPPRHRGRDLHPRHQQRPAARRRAGPRASPCGTSPPARSRAWPRTTCRPSCAPSPRGVLRAEAMREPGWYDVIHSHYWLSGQVGWLAKDRWGVPLVHSMHTMAKVKNANLAVGDCPEPRRPHHRRGAGGRRVRPADRLHRAGGRTSWSTLYGADPAKVVTVAPGVDLERFRPGSRAVARTELGPRRTTPSSWRSSAGSSRSRPPTCVLHAAARLVERDRALRDRLVVLVVGGASGSGLAEPAALAKLAGDLGISDLVRFVPPGRPGPARPTSTARPPSPWCPSHNESFGLVALESQACGTPVIAAAVGGLRTAVSRRPLRPADPRPRPGGLRRGRTHRRRLSVAAAQPRRGRRRPTPASSAGRSRLPACSRPTARRSRRPGSPSRSPPSRGRRGVVGEDLSRDSRRHPA